MFLVRRHIQKNTAVVTAGVPECSDGGDYTVTYRGRLAISITVVIIELDEISEAEELNQNPGGAVNRSDY